jgi:hypothetical protein
MGKRILHFILLAATIFQGRLAAQNDKVTIRTDFEMGKAYHLQQAANWMPAAPTFNVNEKGRSGDDPNPLPPYNVGDEDETSAKTTGTNGFMVNVGRNFVGNHLTGGTPSDNTVAISNDGLIVSADNYSIAYFKENGDTITQFGLPLGKFYSDTTMKRDPFDPRVIYDSYENRFIFVSLFRSNDYKQSRMLLSFSKPLVADTVEWYQYQINCDSIFTSANEAMYYFDYPNIAASKSQLLVALSIQKRDTNAGTNSGVTNVVFQIDKGSGYANAQSLAFRSWKNIENADNRKDINLVPAMDALQGESYDTLCYLVQNYSSGSSKFFWFELNGSIGSANAQLLGHSTLPAFFYSTPSYASQLGGNGGDRISVLDCDIQYALFQNNKLHFVFTRSNQDWAELVYANINVSTNAFTHSELDGVANSENFLRPSIASYGVDSTDENYMIGFLRTGPNQYPEICAVNYDSTGWSLAPTSVKAGLGILDLRQDLVAPWDSLERWGDYTCIQRRYSDPFKRCWMVGAHAFGLAPNHFGRVSGVNAWIAELGDSLPAIGIAPPSVAQKFVIAPNPASNTNSVTAHFPNTLIGTVVVANLQGQVLAEVTFSGKYAEIPVANLPDGMYFVTAKTKGLKYETQKLIVRN